MLPPPKKFKNMKLCTYYPAAYFLFDLTLYLGHFLISSVSCILIFDLRRGQNLVSRGREALFAGSS